MPPHDLDAHGLDARDLLANLVTRQAIGRDAVAHHPAWLIAAIADLDRVPEVAQMVGAREARGTCADDQDSLTGRRTRCDAPAFVDRQIAKEAVERMDGDRGVEVLSVAAAFAGVIAGTPMRRRQRVVLHVLAPGVLPTTRLGKREPCLDVESRGTGLITGRQMIDVHRPLPPEGTRALGDGCLVTRGQVVRRQRVIRRITPREQLLRLRLSRHGSFASPPG